MRHFSFVQTAGASDPNPIFAHVWLRSVCFVTTWTSQITRPSYAVLSQIQVWCFAARPQSCHFHITHSPELSVVGLTRVALDILKLVAAVAPQKAIIPNFQPHYSLAATTHQLLNETINSDFSGLHHTHHTILQFLNRIKDANSSSFYIAVYVCFFLGLR